MDLFGPNTPFRQKHQISEGVHDGRFQKYHELCSLYKCRRLRQFSLNKATYQSFRIKSKKTFEVKSKKFFLRSVSSAISYIDTFFPALCCTHPRNLNATHRLQFFFSAELHLRSTLLDTQQKPCLAVFRFRYRNAWRRSSALLGHLIGPIFFFF